MAKTSTHQAFTSALDALIGQVKADRSILAAILGGSLSHDRVWARSDIDLVLVTIDDPRVKSSGIALYADGVNVHALLMPRTEFRKTVEGSADNWFMHSFLAKGRLLYTHDPTIADLHAALSTLGSRDRQLQQLHAATMAVGCINKAHKWLITRGDLEYTSLWILYAATPIASLEVLSAGRIVDREVIPQALALNPAVFRTIYADLMNAPKTRPAVAAALAAADEYLSSRAVTIFAPVIDYLREVGEARSSTDLDFHFARHFGIEDVTVACEYLADQKLIGKASLPVRLTKRSNIEIQELAFFHDGGRGRGR